MKILNISKLRLNDSHNYYGGSIGNIAYNLLRAISEIEDVEVITFTGGVSLKNDVPLNLKILKFESFSDIKREMKKIIENEIDVVTHFYFHEPVYNPVAELAKKRKVPFVIGMCEPPHTRFSDEIGGLLKIPFVRYLGKRFILPKFKRTLELCEKLVVVNEYAKKYYSRFIDEKKIRVIPHGVSLERFKYTPLPTSHNILAVSTLIKRKGLDYLVEAMPLVLEKYPDASLHLVGEGARKRVLLEKAEDLKMSSRIRFHGYVSSEELVNHYKNCYLFCHMSFAGGWNQPALESMASGRPVICTDAPHNSMVEDEETGFLIPFGDVDILAKKIISLFEDYELARRMGIEGRRKVEREYNWYKIAREYYRILREIS